MILVRKNVYKDVCLLKMFSILQDDWKCAGVCFENSKDICFKMEQLTKINLPTQMYFLFIFSSFDIVVLPLIW